MTEDDDDDDTINIIIYNVPRRVAGLLNGAALEKYGRARSRQQFLLDLLTKTAEAHEAGELNIVFGFFDLDNVGDISLSDECPWCSQQYATSGGARLAIMSNGNNEMVCGTCAAEYSAGAS